MILIQPSYQHLRAWIEQLPSTFFSQGEIIYNARNQIRVIKGPDGRLYNVKRYCVPKWFNRLIYTWFRPSKAKRAYDNALQLQTLGIATPAPVAYLLCGKKLLAESFLITQQVNLPHRLYEWGDGLTEGREEVMRAFGRFTAQMHNRHVLHLDYSPGNILYDKVDGTWQFAIVDINRMHFGSVSIEQGCANLGRLWGEEAVYHLIAEGYALERKADIKTCYQQMWHAHQRFWNNRKKPIEYQSKVIPQ